MNFTEDRVQGIVQAMADIQDRAVIEAKRAVVQVIAQLLSSLLEGIATLDGKIEEATRAHPDFSFRTSLLECLCRSSLSLQELGFDEFLPVRMAKSFEIAMSRGISRVPKTLLSVPALVKSRNRFSSALNGQHEIYHQQILSLA